MRSGAIELRYTARVRLTWCHSSDADSDVLADYVLALIRSDAPDQEIRKASIENLEDFLKESELRRLMKEHLRGHVLIPKLLDTVKFVDEIFEKYNPKPQAAPVESVSQSAPDQPMHFAQSMSPVQTAPFMTVPIGASGSPGRDSFQGQPSAFGSRKRSFNDVSQGDEHDSQYRSHDRPYKALRGRRGGRGERTGGGWDSRRPASGGPSFLANPQGGFPGMPPAPPSGFPQFDPSDPMAAMLALQSMGFPQLPGMPNLSALAQNQNGSPPAKIPQRCNNYDTQGFCVLGSTCPYQHGPEPLVTSTKDDGKKVLPQKNY